MKGSSVRISYFRPSTLGLDLSAEFGRPGMTVAAIDSPAEMVSAARHSEVLIFNNPVYSADLAAALAEPNCPVRWIHFTSAGFDGATKHGVPSAITVSNSGDVWAPTVAEHAVAGLLALKRALPQSERARQAGAWERTAIMGEISSLEGARVGVLGFGNVGRNIAMRLEPFGCDIVAFARTARADESIPVLSVDGLDATLPALDALIVTLPLDRDTQHFVDARRLDLMKASAIIVNIGRGPTVDAAALCERLKANRIGGAVLDVFDTEPLPASDPLWQAPRLVLTPHVAGYGSPAAAQRLLALCRENLRRYVSGAELLGTVRF